MDKTIEGVNYNSDKLIAEIIGYDNEIKKLKTRKPTEDKEVTAAKTKYTESKKTTDKLKKEWKDSSKGLGKKDVRIVNLTYSRKSAAKLFSNIFAAARNEKDQAKRLGFKKEYDLAVSKSTKTTTTQSKPATKSAPAPQEESKGGFASFGFKKS